MGRKTTEGINCGEGNDPYPDYRSSEAGKGVDGDAPEGESMTKKDIKISAKDMETFCLGQIKAN